jgi:2-keto-4-pentenoate hydratase/2-oxohepta-3-ene-1,7-dioic acid hydratase in catechol pathway
MREPAAPGKSARPSTSRRRSACHRAADAGDINKAAYPLDVDGVTKQSATIAHLIWSVNETIANLSTLFALAPGDLIFSGHAGRRGRGEAGPDDQGQHRTAAFAHGPDRLTVRRAESPR